MGRCGCPAIRLICACGGVGERGGDGKGGEEEEEEESRVRRGK